jgi:hypothetical protein
MPRTYLVFGDIEGKLDVQQKMKSPGRAVPGLCQSLDDISKLAPSDQYLAATGPLPQSNR